MASDKILVDREDVLKLLRLAHVRRSEDCQWLNKLKQAVDAAPAETPTHRCRWRWAIEDMVPILAGSLAFKPMGEYTSHDFWRKEVISNLREIAQKVKQAMEPVGSGQGSVPEQVTISCLLIGRVAHFLRQLSDGNRSVAVSQTLITELQVDLQEALEGAKDEPKAVSRAPALNH
ncbi:MAG TPA: hypothetical protein VK963_02555 [Candidatus Saccharimonadales bacterium]|nr:hypothetical protein [Candidatus Saccharimonadales bacterium]